MSDTPAARNYLPSDQLAKLRALFAEQAEKGATIFHQAHAEELLSMADELIALRSETRTPSEDSVRIAKAIRKNPQLSSEIVAMAVEILRLAEEPK